MQRRARTRHLIELGGLVVKSGLVEATHDDRVAMFGGFIELAARLQGMEREQSLVLLRRRGRRSFNEADMRSRDD